MLNTILKAGQVLSLFDRTHPEWGVSEVAEALHAPKSSAHELLASLTHIGLLQHTGRGRYRLGWQMLTFSQTLLDTTEFRAQARQPMEELAAQYRETVHLAILDGNMVVYADKLQGTQAVQVSITGLGARLPAHGSAVGKVLLAHCPWPRVLQIVGEQGMPAFTPSTITTIDELQSELDRVCKQGYAYDIEEVVPDLCCVAAPIRDYSGQVVASMSLAVPAYRFRRSRDEYRAAIIRTCQQVSKNLGYIELVKERRRTVNGNSS
jgi:DNA-binding IclR family transcriptional regulator